MLIFRGNKYSRNYKNGNKVSWKCNKVGCNARVTSYGTYAPKYTESGRGNLVMLLGPHRYKRQRHKGYKIRWICSQVHYGCKASVTTLEHRIVRATGSESDMSEDFEYYFGKSKRGALRFEMTRFGNPIITWGKYRFIKKLTRREKTWWECNSRKSSGCRCLAVTVNDQPKFDLSQRGNLVVQIGEWRFNKHACWGSKVRWTCIKKKSGYLNPVFAQSQRGNPVIMIGQYRFNRVNKYGSRTRWVCVKAKAGCRASLHTMDNAIVRVWGFHDPLAHTSANRF
ncbi:uncharacterized protein LOC119190095 [Manduca sexta]|uniref:uncharacterized protein LOC119190095 n=1 Tax=Manduca sexta TaxID=7130 RepID=UPI00188F598B|nr:uncharacterized protein LOC119190095 [Manduca sexta]